MISAILCTRNRSSQLALALEQFGNVEYDGQFELIVVNNGSSDDTSNVIASFASRSDFPVTEVKEATPGLANARNAGVAASSGSVIVFTDDDCYVDRHFLTEMTRPFKWDHIGFVGGRIVLHDETDARMTIRLDERPMTYLRANFIGPGHIQGAAMAFRRDVLEQIGGFDPLFGSGAHFPAEDFDSILRASQSGWYGIYWPDALVRHHHGRKTEDVPALVKAYSIGRGAVFAKLLFRQHAFKIARQMLYWRLRGAFRDPGSFIWEAHGFFGYLARMQSSGTTTRPAGRRGKEARPA
ncbi:MAG: glycosyltransferase family 2 protein [Devosia sp.]|nr:glycosyltransferase family 2 protein [Devosia sp.]